VRIIFMSTAATTSVSSNTDCTVFKRSSDTKKAPKITPASKICTETLIQAQSEHPPKRPLNSPQRNVRPSKAARANEKQASPVRRRVVFKKDQPKDQKEFSLDGKKAELVERLTEWKEGFSASLNLLEKNLHGATALLTMNTTQKKIQEALDVPTLIQRLEYPKNLLVKNKWLFSSAAQEKLAQADKMLTKEILELKKHV